MPVDQSDEYKELNNYAREVFGKFSAWWIFFITQNLVAAGLIGRFLMGEEHDVIQYLITWVTIFVDAAGVGYGILVSLRLVQIDDRLVEICRGRSVLGNPHSVPRLFKQLVRKSRAEPRRPRKGPTSPLPLRFYLLCTLPVSVAATCVTAAWIVGVVAGPLR